MQFLLPHHKKSPLYNFHLDFGQPALSRQGPGSGEAASAQILGSSCPAAEAEQGRDEGAPSKGVSVLLGGFVLISARGHENWAFLASDLFFPTLCIIISASLMGKEENKLSQCFKKFHESRTPWFRVKRP